MTEGVNRQVVLASRPAGYPEEGNFRVVEAPVPEPHEGQLLVRTLWLSLDPYMRGRMGASTRSYAPPQQIGEVMVGGTVGRVVASRNPAWATGDIGLGAWGWQEYAVSDGHSLRRLDPGAVPISTALGVLGMPGATAYFGLFDVGRPRPGDTVVVSAAAGAVGAIVGQLARLAGCRAVGIAGSDAKIAYIVDELGFDAGINYKTEDVGARLAETCPRGVDVYFDNVGGAVTDAVFRVLADRARVAVCGQISQYNLETPDVGPRNLRYVLARQAQVEGFLVSRFSDRAGEARDRMTRWVQEGRVKYREDVAEGLQNAPRAFLGLMHGENLGKLLVKVSDE